MVGIESLFIENNEVKLEAEFFQPNNFIKNPAVLVCHPHPQYGGNMHNNVVSAIFDKLIHNNITCLRFNFRAVGNSTGTHSNGKAELNDVKACIDFLINKKKYEKIILCGYSYGAAIGCSAINYSNKVIAYIAISFPWDLMGKQYKEFSQSYKPKLFIQGNQDTIAVYSNFKAHFEFYKAPKNYKIINGADHFFWGYEKKVATEVLKFYELLNSQ
jgi:alpha/beta superfamily hydrolase